MFYITGLLGCSTLISHGFFIFFYPSLLFIIPVGFFAFLRPPISPLGLPMRFPLAYLPASISTIDLPSPTSSTDIKNPPTMFASNLFQKYSICHSSLAIRRKRDYLNASLRLPALSGGQKKGPKWLLRAFFIHSPKQIRSLSSRVISFKKKNQIQRK